MVIIKEDSRKPIKHAIEHFLFHVSVVFKNNNKLTIYMDCKDCNHAEEKFKTWALNSNVFEDVSSVMIAPVLEVV